MLPEGKRAGGDQAAGRKSVKNLSLWRFIGGFRNVGGHRPKTSEYVAVTCDGGLAIRENCLQKVSQFSVQRAVGGARGTYREAF